MDNPVVIAVVLTLAVGLVFYAFLVPRSETNFQITGNEDAKQTTWMKVLGVTSAEIFATLPAGLAERVQGKPKSEIELLLQRSGNPWNLKANEFGIVRLVTCIFGILAGAGIGFLMGKAGVLDFPLPAWMAVVGLFGYFVPLLKYKSAANERNTNFKRQLPDALDLLIISLSSGTTFPNALRESLPNMRPGVLRDEFREVSRRLDSGKTLQESLEEFAKKAPSESITSFVRAVQEATELNVPLIEVLESRADASRQEYFALLQQKTASLESRMMAVLTPTLVPALLITVMAPAISQLMNMMGS